MGPFPFLTSQSTLGMTESLRRRLQQALLYGVYQRRAVATLCLLAFRSDVPARSGPSFGMLFARLLILGILSESFSFTIPVAER